ncbi:MAG: 30S ribosomal protein S13 [Planctomycetaceae bacterium]|nr:30S ribosomal protein S13 [Planctomycetota bacterium]NUN51805.1 30S ribosomal protein S13 [Planctomycetaceae bacterium]
MPRIVGVDVPAEKKIGVALTYIYGIGRRAAGEILEDLGINPQLRSKALSDEDLSRITSLIEKKFVVEGQLRRQIAQNISRLKEIKCYRGIRHIKNLPTRGQRTRSNARTRKGPRRTVARKKSVKELG